MKKNIFVKGLAGILVAGSLASCSEDYLQIEPETSVDTSTVTSSVEGAELALIGMCRAMYQGYQIGGSNLQFFNGEATIMTFYGDLFGPDYYNYLWGRYGADFMKWGYFQDDTTWIPSMVWMYSYNIINQANVILSGIDDASGDANARDFIKAQALTMRAHAYWRLLQVYAPRWVDSNNGAADACVLRTTPGTGGAPLVSMKTILDLIYEDLDTAISLYSSCGQKRTTQWEPNIDVARGVYARVALLCNDWETAQKMAKAARASYPIMSAEEYKGGFANSNGEWMWSNANDELDQLVGYYSWGALYACNGSYVSFWGEGCGAMSIDLANEVEQNLSADDIRLDLYWLPQNLDKVPAGVRGNLRPQHFWSNRCCDPSTMNMNGMYVNMTNSINRFGSDNIPNDDFETFGLPYQQEGDSEGGGKFVIPFGAQYKFWGIGQYSNSSYPFMRGAEMALTEAEAAYHNGDESTARAALEEVNKQRIEGYTCSKSGQALLDEIRLSRRIELWGEGTSWFDWKRWNLPFEIRAWVADDPTSGSFPPTLATRHDVTDKKGWTMCIPMIETDYNDALDPTKGSVK